MKVKGVRLYGVKDIRLEEFEIPEIAEDEILLKIECNGIAVSTLKEISWGINEGLATSEDVLLRYNHAVSSWQNGHLDERVEGGESARELGQRCLFTLDWLKQVERKNILICSHGRTIRALVCLLLEKPLSRMEEVSHKNLGLYRFLFQNGKWTCSVKDDITHLIP